jgi:O-antigen ligase
MIVIRKFTSIKNLMCCLLTLIFYLPQLNNIHYAPSAQFWTEITTAYCILLSYTVMTVLLLLDKNKKNIVHIPLITLYLIIFGIYIIIQSKINPNNFIGLNIIVLLEMIILILLSINVSSLNYLYSLSTIFMWVSVVLVIGGILQSTIGILQFTGLAQYCNDLIFYDYIHPTTNIFGHFGQRNHYCHYISWSIFALIYLFKQKKINFILFMSCLFYFCFAITISGSRSVFLYFLTAILVSGLMLLKKNKDQVQLFILVVLATVTMLFTQYSWTKFHSHKFVSQSGLQRLEDNANDRRYTEWQKAFLLFQQHPIFGIGWNQFAKHSMSLQKQFAKAPTNSGLFTNCHNIFLQLAAETGIVGLLIFSFSIISIIFRLALIKNHSIEITLILSIVGTTMMHSLTEYPLWYIYFLAPFIFFCALDKPIIRISAKYNAIMFTTINIVMWYLLIYSSISYNNIVNKFAVPSDQNAIHENVTYLVNVIENDVLLSYYANFTVDEYIKHNLNIPLSKQQQFKYENQLNDFHPYPDTMLKTAIFYNNFGDIRQAKQVMFDASTAYPNYKRYYQQKLAEQKLENLLSK